MGEPIGLSLIDASAPGTPSPLVSSTEGHPPSIVRALLRELFAHLEYYLATKQTAAIDLLRLPLSSDDVEQLRAHLGRGEAILLLRGMGRSRILETDYAGLWWVEHRDNRGRIQVRSIEVGATPSLLPSQSSDIQASAKRLADELRQPTGIIADA